MKQQLAFDLPANVSLGPDDFFVSVANAKAYVMIMAPESWIESKLAIIGPPGSGKSHLARVFQHQRDALVFSADALDSDMPLPNFPVVIEDAERITPDGEEALFHIHNHMKQRRLPLLLTSSLAPGRWPIELPDLASRMQATSTVQIDDPDDRLLAAVLMKQFADRQLMPKPHVITYIASHIERSFAAASDIVNRMDSEALYNGARLNIPLARRLLDIKDDSE